MKINKILDEVLDEIRPDENYKKDIFSKLNEIISHINKNNIWAKAVLGGSGAKGTLLRSFDADIFVLFNYAKYRDKSSQISDILERILRKKFKKFSRLHGSRDYFQIKEKNYTFEIIPILQIKNSSQAMNITDISPLHSKWVLKNKKIVNQMKLTKQFCKAQSIYGAESYIRGLSGYVCEILSVHYGSFISVMKNAAKWPDKVVIDTQKYYKGQDVFKIINTSKLESPLVIIDPVQKERNAAAALSFEKFDMLRTAAKSFITRPSKDFFEKKDLSLEIKTKNRNRKIINVKLSPILGKIDVVGSKMQKIYEFLSSEFSKNDFKIIKSQWSWDEKDEANMYFVFDKKQLSKEVVLQGPPLKMSDNVQKFKKSHKRTISKKGKLFAIEKRKFINPEDMLNSLIKNNYVKERSSSSKFQLL